MTTLEAADGERGTWLVLILLQNLEEENVLRASEMLPPSLPPFLTDFVHPPAPPPVGGGVGGVWPLKMNSAQGRMI